MISKKGNETRNELDENPLLPDTCSTKETLSYSHIYVGLSIFQNKLSPKHKIAPKFHISILN